MTMVPDELHKTFQKSLKCKVCFESPQHNLTRPLVDMAQPRWIGPGYWKTTPKIALVLTNPGAGNGYGDTENRRLNDLLKNIPPTIRL